MSIQRVLIVCTGNICRSPMAEGLMRAALPGVSVASAGTHALVGAAADETACLLMRARDLPIDGHRARQLDDRLCLGADVILVMENAHRQLIRQRHPHSTGKVFRITQQVDVPDPYRRTRAAFQLALALIEEGARAWAHRISRVSQP